MVVKIKVDYERVKASIIKGLSEIEIPILKSYYYCVDVYIKNRDDLSSGNQTPQSMQQPGDTPSAQSQNFIHSPEEKNDRCRQR